MLFDVSVAILSKFPKACRKHPDPVPSDQQLGRRPNPQEWHLDILDWRPRDRVLQEMGNDGKWWEWHNGHHCAEVQVVPNVCTKMSSFLPYGFVATVLTRFGVAELMCLLSRMSYKAKATATGSSGESLSSKTWQVDARRCQVMPGVRCTVSWLRASRCRSVPKWPKPWPKLPAPLSASQCLSVLRLPPRPHWLLRRRNLLCLEPTGTASMHDEKKSKRIIATLSLHFWSLESLWITSFCQNTSRQTAYG